MKNKWDTCIPALLMVTVQFVYSGCNVIYKLAANDGMSTIVIAAYRLAFAAITTIPLALIFESLEKLNWGAASGKAKVIGTLLGLIGAMLLTFYKGEEFDTWPFYINLLDPQQNQNGHVADTSSELLGVLFVVIGCFCFSLWLILQAKMMEEYPCPISSVAMLSTIATIQCVIFDFIVERDLNDWKLGWNIRLLTVLFAGILGSGLMILATGWVVQKKGPLFTSAFNPLMLLIVAVVASMLLDEKLNLGSVLGGVLIVCGLYSVLWGKNKEMQNKTLLETSEINGDSEAARPLLNP